MLQLRGPKSKKKVYFPQEIPYLPRASKVSKLLIVS